MGRTYLYMSRFSMILGVLFGFGGAAYVGLLVVLGGSARTDLGMWLLLAVLLGIGGVSLWRLVRLRIANDASLVGSALVVSSRGKDITLSLEDLRVGQVVSDPYSPFFFPGTSGGLVWGPKPAWQYWLRIDALDGVHVRRYLLWRSDASAFLSQLKQVGVKTGPVDTWPPT